MCRVRDAQPGPSNLKYYYKLLLLSSFGHTIVYFVSLFFGGFIDMCLLLIVSASVVAGAITALVCLFVCLLACLLICSLVAPFTVYLCLFNLQGRLVLLWCMFD